MLTVYVCSLEGMNTVDLAAAAANGLSPELGCSFPLVNANGLAPAEADLLV